MKNVILVVFLVFAVTAIHAQSPVGKWKKVSHASEFEGQKFDSHAALLTQRPCAAKIVYEINADGTFRLNASNSGCDEQYVSIQEKLYSKTQWKLEGDLFTVSATNFAVGQSYRVRFSGNNMTWTGTEGQGVIVYQRL